MQKDSIKSRRRKPAAPKRGGGTRSRGASAASQESKSAQSAREFAETRRQHTATTNVLRIISSSAWKLEPVFRAILENAVSLCGAKLGSLHLYE
jgi:hypothetical protein